MAKTLGTKRLVLLFEVKNNATEISCRADYEVNAEDLASNRSLVYPLTTGQKTAVQNFVTAITTAIMAKEGID